MSKKWWAAIVALFALAAVLAIAIPALVPPTPGVTYANYSRIEAGMTRAQVEALLGKPNSNERFVFFGFGGVLRTIDTNDASWVHWQSKAGDQLSIDFDTNDCVRATTWNGWEDDRTDLEKLRDRLPWRAKRPPTMLYIVD